jgi:hypothetical protein
MTPKYELLPRDKYDDEAVEKLALLPEAELLPLLPGLAEWIQDSNWPIARAVEKLLKLHVTALVPTILEVLAGRDEQWQWNLLYLINPTTLPTLPAPLRAALVGMATYPATGEYDMYLVWQARYVLGLYGSHPLLPQTKTDCEAVERLSQLSEAELLPLLPGLAEWLEDTNWPVSRPTWNFLLSHVAELEPFIVEVLMGHDDIWKCNLLRLVKQSALSTLSTPMRELTERIAHSPTVGERENDTAEAARELLARFA